MSNCKVGLKLWVFTCKYKYMNEIAQNLSKLLKTFNDKRVISEGEIKEVLAAIIAILAENKKSVEALSNKATEFLSIEAKKKLEEAQSCLEVEHQALLKTINNDLSKT